MKRTERILITGGRLIDPASGVDGGLALALEDGRVCGVGELPPGFRPERLIDATGCVVCPGLIDLSARPREPGMEHKATIASETRAAAASGITTLCCPPDTSPVIDTAAMVTLVRQRAQEAGHARVLPQGALTQGLGGDQLSEMAALLAAGCVAFGNGGLPLGNTLIERRALEYAATFDATVILRPEDRHLADNGCAHEGAVATRLGLPGIPAAAETVALARDLALVQQTGARVHFHSLSCGSAVAMLQAARHQHLPVSADVAAHQLHLTEMDIEGFDSNCHVHPPLRAFSDREHLRQGVRDGSIDAICSDHQPHEADAKAAPFPATAPGISGLETLLPLTLKLVQEGVLELPRAIALLTSGPARILGLPYGRLRVGDPADVCIFDPDRPWELKREAMRSAGRNTPFAGWEFSGRVTHTLLEGRIVHEERGPEPRA